MSGRWQGHHFVLNCHVLKDSFLVIISPFSLAFTIGGLHGDLFEIRFILAVFSSHLFHQSLLDHGLVCVGHILASVGPLHQELIALKELFVLLLVHEDPGDILSTVKSLVDIASFVRVEL